MKSASYGTLVRVSYTSADIPGALQRISANGIQLKNVASENDLTILFSLQSQDLPRLRKLAERQGDSLEILIHEGGDYSISKLFGRKILLFGFAFILLVTWILPRRILFLQVEGNQTIPTRKILEAAQQSGVSFGASREDVRSERVKNAMLEMIPQLQWVGINTYGCVAVISIREQAEQEQSPDEKSFGHVVAVRDGVILSCNATCGNLLCSPGQAVTQGEILISGYTDCGLVIRAEQAEGEVYALTKHELSVKTPLTRMLQLSSEVEKKKISLLIGKKRINLWKDSGIYDTVCDRMYEEYYAALPGGFTFPLALCVDRYTLGTLEQKSVPAEDTQDFLIGYARDYLKSQMVGGTVRQENHAGKFTQDSALLAGEYVCVEMIGAMQREKIGERNGQSD